MKDILNKYVSGEKVEQKEILEELIKNPDIALKFMAALIKSGAIK